MRSTMSASAPVSPTSMRWNERAPPSRPSALAHSAWVIPLSMRHSFNMARKWLNAPRPVKPFVGYLRHFLDWLFLP